MYTLNKLSEINYSDPNWEREAEEVAAEAMIYGPLLIGTKIAGSTANWFFTATVPGNWNHPINMEYFNKSISDQFNEIPETYNWIIKNKGWIIDNLYLDTVPFINNRGGIDDVLGASTIRGYTYPLNLIDFFYRIGGGSWGNPPGSDK